jgi:cytoskeletal protein RodZ
MTSPRDKDPLDRLYQDQPPLEPPAGLDRMIRARAEQAVEKDQRPRTLPWMGGLATAAVLVLAVSVVIQMPEPRPDLPRPESVSPNSIESSARQTPTEPAAAPTRAPSQSDRLEISENRARSAAFSDQALAAPAPTAEARRPAPTRDEVDGASESAEASLQASPSSAGVNALAESESPLWRALEAAIDAGDRQRAEELLEQLREEFPDDARLKDLQARVREIEPQP